MYIPRHFRQNDREEIFRFIRAHSFATLITMGEKHPIASHLPIELEINERGETALWGHMARGNRQWRSFDQNLEVLVIFQSHNSYISSSWYSEPEVPTWNYLAVHVYGKAVALSEEMLREALRRQMDRYERDSKHPVSMETLPKSVVESQLKGVFGFEISIDRIEASYKLSQNRSEHDYETIIGKLAGSDDPQKHGIAECMQKLKKDRAD
jgi:transcriptional regulator